MELPKTLAEKEENIKLINQKGIEHMGHEETGSRKILKWILKKTVVKNVDLNELIYNRVG
jgi:ABC-type Zn uptake system ZnuABC Zn-binding protein ZnuA